MYSIVYISWLFTCSVDDSGENWIFLHIPKTGGTAIEELHPSFSLSRKVERCSVWHTPIQWLSASEKKLNYDTRKVFTLVRHPYDRMISQYKFMCWASKPGLNTLGYVTNLFESCKRNVTQMNDFIHLHVEHLSVWGNDKQAYFDCHFIPQYYYFQNANRIFCNMSDLKRFVGALYQEGRHHKLHGLPKYDHSVLDSKSKAILNRVYASDFLKCGFKNNMD